MGVFISVLVERYGPQVQPARAIFKIAGSLVQPVTEHQKPSFTNCLGENGTLHLKSLFRLAVACGDACELQVVRCRYEIPKERHSFATVGDDGNLMAFRRAVRTPYKKTGGDGVLAVNGMDSVLL